MAQLSTQDIEQRLKALPGWSLTPEGIRKTYRQPNFRAAVALVNWVAELAEAMDHHPDVLIHGYRRVTFTIMTHSEKAVTEKDFTLATQIEQLGGPHQ